MYEYLMAPHMQDPLAIVACFLSQGFVLFDRDVIWYARSMVHFALCRQVVGKDAPLKLKGRIDVSHYPAAPELRMA